MTDTSAAFDDYNLFRPEFFTMTTITILSNEIIDIILQQETVGIQDVVNFGLTCKRFLSVLDHNTLWQRKLYQRWPYLKKIYNKRIQNKEIINFKDDVKASIKCRNELRCYLSLMSERLHHKNLSNIDLEHFNLLHSPNMDTHIMNYYFLTDELIYLVTMLPSALLHNCDLTHRYYGKILLPCLQQQYLKKVWQEFVNYPKEQQLLERAATIVAQWYQPQKRIFYLDVEASLDNITQQVLEDLKKIHREHPIFSTSAKQFSFWKHNINGNQWNKKEERQIIDVIRTVLFDELGFHSPVSQTDILIPKSDDILIDCVLESKVGNAISLTIVFQSIARRLGVRCDLISFPTHFFLSWKPKCSVENPKDEEYFYIDVLHNGAIRSSNDCPRTRGRRCPIDSFNVPNEISPTEMVLRMIDQLRSVRPNYQHHQDRTLQIRSLLEFRYMIEPYDIDTIEMLGSHYIRYQMSLSGLIITLQRILDSYSDRTSMEAGRAEMTLRRFEMHALAMTAPRDCIAPKERSKKIKYAVGMIVCNRFGYWGTGVIIDWDEKYNSKVDLIPEYRILRDHSRPDDITLTQPFYTILSENGRTYYAAEDSLIEAHPPRSIDHNEIGRYFCRFARTHYVPNKILTTYYPHDLTILNTLRMPEHLH